MKVLVVGGGGREHALVWKIKQSKRVEKVLCAPGNAGIARDAVCVPVAADDVKGLCRLAREEKVDLAVVGPEGPLTLGLSDRLEEQGIMVFGCSQAAAELEGSKIFAKLLMERYRIPTAAFRTADNLDDAIEAVEELSRQMVVKADGLAAGKGVIVCDNAEQGLAALATIMQDRAFGKAGDRVIVEERLFGEEASFLAFTDGETVLPLAGSQDHKAVFDNDEGPNTGGMGAYSPAPVLTQALHDEIMDKIMVPAVRAMKEMGSPYRGVLYAGVMVTEEGPKALEFNARFGDPETQPLLFRMKSDIIDFLLACARPDGSLAKMKIEWDRPAVCVVMASGGYPGEYDKGFEIKGLEEAAKLPETFVFHAGSAEKDGKIVTSGGRVLGVTARGADIAAAIEQSYRAVRLISWEDAYYRTDIGKKALDRG